MLVFLLGVQWIFRNYFTPTRSLEFVSQEGSGCPEAEEDTFLGQDGDDGMASGSSDKHQMDKEVAAMIPKGIAQFFHQIGGAALPASQFKRGYTNVEVQTDTSYTVSNEEIIQNSLREQNARLVTQVESLRRVVRELESQIASSQDENANLSTGLEELDIQHQEAIERVLTVKDETQKELEQVKAQLELRNEEYACLAENNESLKREIELANLEHLGCETLAQENAHLREKIGELLRKELPSICEQSAAEEHVRSLEAEVAALRESRDNLERESASLLSQIRQRDANLRQIDGRLEEVTKEKEIKEREMTQIVFECNSLREELKANNEKIDNLERTLSTVQLENSTLENKLEESLEEIKRLTSKLEGSRRESELVKEESETLKAELESVKELLDGGQAQALRDCEHLQIARTDLKEATSKIEALKENICTLDNKLSSALAENEKNKVSFEMDRECMERELNELRDIAREYGIQKDIFKEKESELKRQLKSAEGQICNLTSQLSAAEIHLNQITTLLTKAKEENTLLVSRVESSKEKDDEISRFKATVQGQNKENTRLLVDIEKLNEQIDMMKRESQNIEDFCSERPALDVLQNEIRNYQEVVKLQESKIAAFEEDKENATSLDNYNRKEKEKMESEKVSFLGQIGDLKDQIANLVNQEQKLCNEKHELEVTLGKVLDEKETVMKEKLSVEQVNETLLSQVSSLNETNAELTRKLDKLQIALGDLAIEKKKLSDELEASSDFSNRSIQPLNEYGGVDGALQKLTQYEQQLTSLNNQVSHFKDELSELYEEKTKLTSELLAVSNEKDQLLEQVGILRKELDTIVSLKQELEHLKHSLQLKNEETTSFENEIKRINNALSVQLDNNDVLYKEKVELMHKFEVLHVQMQSKMANMEEIGRVKTKEVETLQQEVENLKRQLEYASQLLQTVERQDGEGQPSGEGNSQKASNEVQEEITRLSTALLKEQTDSKLLRNQLEDTKEKLDKAENQLRTLKSHLVEIEDSYSTELAAAEEKLRESQAQLVAAEERARSSSTAYTSASIRANQQVEALREQLRLLGEHKEKLETELSQAEDRALKQSAAVTRLQAVLHQFHNDKQKDIEFETERIRRDLITSEKRNEQLLLEMKTVQEQLAEARRGVAAGQKLSQELLKQSEEINQLKAEIFELKEKLRLKDEKMNELNSENKVDRTLVKNLLVGYVMSPDESKPKALGALGQVLSLSKEERQKVGLEPGGRQPSLSEAFIKFLQSESQPRPELILPLPHASPEPPQPGRSSLLTPEVPVLPLIPVGRNPGSILKDVLQERRPE